MNERLMEMARRSGAMFDHMTWVERDLMPVFERFAELIVKKCANIVWDEAEKTSNSDVNDAGYKIIEHFFGVEE